MNLDELLITAAAWAAQDPDPETRAEMLALIEARDEAGLSDRCSTRLGFGTAGLRGELGAGPNRMNRVLVAQAAAGLAPMEKIISKVLMGYMPTGSSQKQRY